LLFASVPAFIVRDTEGRRQHVYFENSLEGVRRRVSSPRYGRIAADVAKLAVLSKEGDALNCWSWSVERTRPGLRFYWPDILCEPPNQRRS
jgi:hypothetical protein